MIDHLVKVRDLINHVANMVTTLAEDLHIAEVVEFPHVLAGHTYPKFDFQSIEVICRQRLSYYI